MKIYNFAAGPSMLADEVKESAQKNFIDYEGSGMSVTEMSHRSKEYDLIHKEAGSLLRELMNIGDDYHVMFLQGGASQQFDAIPLNLLKTGKADYIETGYFAKKAFQSAEPLGDIKVAASSKDRNYSYIPKNIESSVRQDADYVHITTNNTIYGTRYVNIPKLSVPLVGDMSSNILSQEYDVNDFTLIYAGAQKNIGPAGLTVVIAKKDAILNPSASCPIMLKYITQADKDSLYNTPPAFSIYMAMLTFRWLKKLGGVKEVQKINEFKANLLYDFVDNSSFYKNNIEKEDRSLMNVPFFTPTPELDKEFVSFAKSNGLVSLGGHRAVGGMRASIYNAMPVDGVKKLIDVMKEFELNNK